MIIDLHSRAVIGWAMHARLLGHLVAESFFHSLKTELVHHEDYRTRQAATTSIFDYIEVFYNRQRRHSHVGQVAPLVFETAALAAS